MFSDLTTFKMALLIAAMVVTAAAWLPDHLRARRWRQVATVALTVLAAFAWCAESGQRTITLFHDGDIHEWNAFHYMLGGKYFAELGYDDFYNGMALADADADRLFSGFNRMRDLRTNKRIRVTQILAAAEEAGIRERFSDERWEELKGDLRAIQRHRSAARWETPLNDLGFHPSPAWLIVHRPLLEAVDIQRPWVQVALCSSDLWLLLGTIAALVWGFGWRRAMLVTLWLQLYWGNTAILVGGYFHFDWLFWTVLAVVLLKKGRWGLAGVVLAYPAMMRGFPGLLALGPGVVIVRHLWRHRRLSRQHVAFLAMLALGCGVLFGLGCTTGRGAAAWTEWRHKISMHATTHPTGRARVGLVSLSAHDVRRDGWEPTIEERREALQARRGQTRIAQAALLALLLAAMARRKPHDAVLLGLGVVLVALVLSRYYFCILGLALTWPALDRRRLGNLASDLALLGLPLFFYATDRYSLVWQYHMVNLLMLGYFIVVAGCFLIRDGRTWWARRRRRRGGVSSAGTA